MTSVYEEHSHLHVKGTPSRKGHSPRLVHRAPHARRNNRRPRGTEDGWNAGRRQPPCRDPTRHNVRVARNRLLLHTPQGVSGGIAAVLVQAASVGSASRLGAGDAFRPGILADSPDGNGGSLSGKTPNGAEGNSWWSTDLVGAAVAAAFAAERGGPGQEEAACDRRPFQEPVGTARPAGPARRARPR